MLQNIPCSDIVLPNFIVKYSILHCRRNAPTLFSRGENNWEDNIFPYADVPHRTRCVICERLKYFEFVGAAISRPPTWQILEQNRIGQTRVPMLRICHVPTGYHRISPHYVRWCIVGALRRRCFPAGERTGRLIAGPTNL